MDQHPHPPKWSVRLLHWFCKPWYAEAIEGDLYEIYRRRCQHSPRSARWEFSWNVIRFFRWRYIKDLGDFQPKSSAGMLKNYLKVSWRSMLRHKTQSFLNVFGLSVGIACCMLILMHVTTQLRYDKHIPDLDRVYRVVLNGRGPYTPARLVKQMREDYPEIETGTRIMGTFESVINVGEGYVRQEGCIMADSTFFEVFPASFIQGSPATALSRPGTVVLTESAAKTIFHDRNPIGAVVTSEEEHYEVTAVVKDPPATSTIPYRAIVSMPKEYWVTTGWWTGNNFFSYLKLKEGADREALDVKFRDFTERHIGEELLKFNSQYSSFEEYIRDGNSHFFSLIPMKDIHLHHAGLTLGRPGSYTNLLIFSIIAFFILIIACINYVNMATARSSLRAKEIGMRKVLGSEKRLIARQFMLESFLVTAMAMAVGVVLGIVALPYFNQVSDSTYQLTDVLNGRNALWLLAILMAAGLVSGSYPALYLSSFKPIVALRGEVVKGGSRRVRMALVVFQFAISIFLIAATLIVHRQVSFMSDRALGLHADQTFIIQGAGKVLDHLEAFRNELLANNNIAAVGVSNSYPSSFMGDWFYRTSGENPVTVSPYNLFVSEDIADVWGLKVTAGRFFDDTRATDTAAVVINEHLAETLGWEEPVGKTLSRSEHELFHVIGVVQNFVTGSAKKGDVPVIFRTTGPRGVTDSYGYLTVKVTGSYQASIQHMESVWKKFVPNSPFDGLFMDDSFDQLYHSERRFGKLFTGFSTIAVVIACVGMFALASFTLERKRKEIAIRKVMGAGAGHVMVMISRSFLVLILIGASVALPTVYFLGNSWLEDYVYRINIGMLQLALPVFMVILISLATIGYQTYRSAVSNPVNALKEE